MRTFDLGDEPTQQGLRKSLLAGSIGVFVHWFDWAVYAYLATTMAQIFFPEQDGNAGLLAVFAVFAVAFLVRPLGSVLFGYIGDRYGRKKTLSIVIMTMAGGTLLMGVLPSYDTVGLVAPVLLVVARIVQGLAAGGEFGSAAAFLAEYSPRNRRGFGCSWIEFGSVMGFLAASFAVWVLQTTLTESQVLAFGWRIPFLLTVPMALVGLYIRLRIEDTPEYRTLERLQTVAAQPVREVFRANGRQLAQTIGIETFMNATFYVVLVYLLTYQEQVVGLTPSQAALLSTVASFVAIGIIPLSGIASDRYGRKPVLRVAGVLLVLASVPLFVLMQAGTLAAGFVATLGLAVVLSIILGTHAATVAELFPTRTRQSGLSMGYSVAGAFFAGTLPYVITWLIGVTDNDLVPAFALVVIGLIGLTTLATMPETKGIELLQASDTQGGVPQGDLAAAPMAVGAQSAGVGPDSERGRHT